MWCLGRVACVAAALAASALLSPGRAEAGAWTRDKGDGIAIVTTGRRVAPVGSVTGGPIDEDANVSQVYLEYGLIEGLTIGGKLYIELSSVDPTEGSAALGAFVRKRVWQDGKGGVASVEAGYAHPIESLFGETFAYVEPGAVPEAHVSGLYGRGWGGDWGSAFASTGISYFQRGEGTADELRAELTGGYAPSRRFMGILSLYGLMPLGSGSDVSLKVAPSIAVTFWPKVQEGEEGAEDRPNPMTLQLGVNYDVLNPGKGLGLSLSIWRPF